MRKHAEVTHESAQAMMRTARNGVRKLANNTYLHAVTGAPDREGNSYGKPGDYVVRYHGTDVVTIHADGTFTLNSGGWYTYTTKDRISRFSPARIWSERGVWLVPSENDPRTEPRVRKCRACKNEGRACWRCKGAKTADYGSKPNPVRFFDGMRVSAEGVPLVKRNAPRRYDVTATDKKNEHMRKQIAAYVASYTNDEILRLLEAGTAGDCWYCALTTEGRPLGDHGAKDNGTHLAGHVQERYRMASLLRNAAIARGRNWQRFLGMVYGELELSDCQRHSFTDMLRNDVSRYLSRRLLEGRAVK